MNGVSWSPYYDFLAQTADGKTSPEVSLLYCASISQGTGEDWGNATLVLSTASGQNLRNLAIPALDSIKVTTVTGRPAHPHAGGALFGTVPARTSTTAPAVGGLFMQTANAGRTGGILGTNQTIMQQMAGSTNFGQPPLDSSTNRPSLFGAPPPMQAQANTSFGAFGAVTAPSAPPSSEFGALAQGSSFGSSSTSAPSANTASPASAEQTSDATQTADDETADSQFENMSIIDRSPVAATYRLKDKVSIPSDGFVHKVSIARLDFNAQIEYVSVPRKSAGVFVQARVRNTSEYELLAGPVNVFMNNSLVAKAMLPVSADLTFCALQTC